MENDSFNIRDFAGYVAGWLGRRWMLKPLTQIEIEDGGLPHWAEINNIETGAKLSFTRAWNRRTHVHISGQFDNRDANNKEFWHLPYNTEKPSINCAIDKGPAKIAKDIEKRLLPEYIPLLQSLKDAWETHCKAAIGLHGAANDLALDLGGTVRYDQYQADISLYHSSAFADDSVDIKISQYPGHDAPSVSISGLDVTPAECKALFTLLAEMRGKMFVLAEARDGKKL